MRLARSLKLMSALIAAVLAKRGLRGASCVSQRLSALVVLFFTLFVPAKPMCKA